MHIFFAAGKCDAGATRCSSGRHIAAKVINACCTTRVCECNECAAPEDCKEGWTASDTTDDCGCITRECVAPQQCVYCGESHEPGKETNLQILKSQSPILSLTFTYKSRIIFIF